MKRHISSTTNLLAELLQIWHHTVAQAIFHVVSQQVGCTHDSQSFPQRLWEEHRNDILTCLALDDVRHRDKQLKNKKSTDSIVIGRHGLQVVLKGLSPFEGWLELVHLDQVICNNQEKDVKRETFWTLGERMAQERESEWKSGRTGPSVLPRSGRRTG